MSSGVLLGRCPVTSTLTAAGALGVTGCVLTTTGVLGVAGRGVPIGWGFDISVMGDKVSSWDDPQGAQRGVPRLTAVTLELFPPGMAINPRKSGLGETGMFDGRSSLIGLS